MPAKTTPVQCFTAWRSRPAFVNPPIDRRRIDINAAFLEQVPDITIRQREAAVPADGDSADPGASKDYAAHRILLGADRLIVEGLTHLDQVPMTGAHVALAALPVGDAPQIQARVLALVPTYEDAAASD